MWQIEKENQGSGRNRFGQLDITGKDRRSLADPWRDPRRPGAIQYSLWDHVGNCRLAEARRGEPVVTNSEQRYVDLKLLFGPFWMRLQVMYQPLTAGAGL